MGPQPVWADGCQCRPIDVQQGRMAAEVVGPVAGEPPPALLPERAPELGQHLQATGKAVIGQLVGPQRQNPGQRVAAVVGGMPAEAGTGGGHRTRARRASAVPTGK